ncbi:MAG TPA: UbiD family decarboxylase [Chloroflexota bacterium]|nr:UbiD family decarboxylase [Chloroflexota bacterium]HZU04787.1 UbiD family decarboxylase [Chloroflexota bacterium]
MPFADLREFVQRAEAEGELKRIDGADLHLEVGALTELFAFQPNPPALLFDRFEGYPPGYRILTNALNSQRRVAWALGLPETARGVELVRGIREKLRGFQPVPPREVEDGPIYENVLTGSDVDLGRFPVPLWHEGDGGRYIGTGCQVITRDEQTGWVNVGTYRVQVHDRALAGLYMSPGRHGRAHMEPYWARGESAPVLVVCGADPTFLIASAQFLPWQRSEYDYLGWLRGEPVAVVRGEYTGLPMPATAELVIEGEVPPPDREAHPEGPFGEWTGYYASGERAEPVIRVKAIYHRHQPVIHGSPPIRPPASSSSAYLFRAALVWDALEAAGISDIHGVYQLESGASFLLLVISLRPRYAGHARQAALAAMGTRAGAYMTRFVIVVDEDIDPSNPLDVLWAIATRCDPETSIDIIRNCWGTPLDPRLPPEKRAARDFSHSRAIIDATRPFAWRDQFPKVSAVSPELKRRVLEKYASLFQGQ